MAEIRYGRMKLADMAPAEYNPRKDLQPGDHEWEKIENSLETFGMVEPIVFNERSGRIVGGHQRAKILAHNGEEEVDVSIVDLSDEDEKILCAKLNRVQGYWDTTKLAELLTEIKEATGSIEATGFDEWEMSNRPTLKTFRHTSRNLPAAALSCRTKTWRTMRGRSPSCRNAWSLGSLTWRRVPSSAERRASGKMRSLKPGEAGRT